ncbi:MAG: hypothetical protein C4288_11895 [Leptolyngbya sp. ERB_1_1]
MTAALSLFLLQNGECDRRLTSIRFSNILHNDSYGISMV